MIAALRSLPAALEKIAKGGRGLVDTKGLGGDDAEQKFRVWAVKLEDCVAGVFGGRA